MLVIKVSFLNLEKEVTISNKELAKGINACLDNQERFELLAGIISGIEVKKLNTAQLNALKEFANDLYQKTLV